MPTSYTNRNARSRAELICPSCHTEGLDRFDAFAERHDNPRQKLIHGTRCPNCDQRVPPDKVEAQLAPPEWSFAGLSLTIPSIIRDPPTKAIAYATGILAVILMFVIIPTMLGPILGGGTAQTDAPRGGTEVYSDGGWTIYETSDGNYYIYDGTQYLTPTGPSTTPYYYNTEGVARDVLDSYLAYDPAGSTSFEFGGSNNTTSGMPGWSPTNNTSTSTNGTTGPSWTYNGTNDGSGGSGSGGSGGDIYDNPTDGGGTNDWEYQTPTGGDNTNDGGGYQTPSGGDGPSGPIYDDPNSGTNQPDDGYTVPTDKDPLHGAVRDSQGQPIEGVTVTITSTGQEVTTGADGTYTFDEHLPAGTHTLHASQQGLSTPPITLSAESNGDITVDGSPDHAVYVEGSDGTVAQNKLSIVMPDSGAANPITLSGTGSDMTGTVRFQSRGNANSTSITLSGVQSSDHQQVSVSPNTPRVVQINGNTAPNAEINLSSTPVSETVTEQGETSSTTSFELRGNLPTTPTITLNPASESTRQTASGRLSGQQSSTPVTITNRGNVQTPVDVTLRGKSWTRDRQQTGTTETGFSTEIDGYQQPDGQQGSLPELSVTATEHEAVESYSGGGPEFGYYDSGYMATSVFTAPESGMYRVDWHVHQSLYNSQGYSLSQSDSAESGIMVGEAGEDPDIDGYYPDGVATDHLLDEDAYVSVSTQTHSEGEDDRDSASDSGTTTVYLDEGESIYAGGTEETHHAGGLTSSETNTRVESVERLESAGNVTVSAGGVEKTVQDLQKGDSSTVALPLTTGRNDIDVSTSGPVGVDYELEWTEYHRTAGASIQANGETVASIDEGFTGTRTLEIPASAVPPGEREFVFTSAQRADRYDVALEWMSKTVTKQPEVTTSSGRVLFSESGRLESKQTVAVEEPISAGETVEVASGDGPLEYEISYPARVVADSPAVSVNDETYAYPSAFNATGSRLTESVLLNSSALELGQNQLSVSADAVDGIEPSVTATVEYKGSLVISNEPTVTVTNGDGESHTAEVPASQLQNGRLTGNSSLNLPGEWFTTGENTVRVQTADGSVVEAKLTARGIYQQEREFTED
ncbi:uncharacterized protein HHUB_4166 (plasmid) [Halobacterium hubeiense]|uniref:Carboxypeptidase regulatory-like domain-containing protein n=1 Tax=Halobacterium hubeiense TaxID=1407499 RepID=A0A0U5H7K6_9EURY|nr:carboxypeptidase-like regulatory domain-containing protein [Halobacterium hubeiense]CQH63723.1 uncharacterized protein HHUB_4166 [Halobacterium hubeiense]